jgi:hypothetical protein
VAPFMKHAFTVDLEDWYHGIPIAAERKATAERRLHVGTDLLLELLARRGHKATFFALSLIAQRAPGHPAPHLGGGPRRRLARPLARFHL